MHPSAIQTEIDRDSKRVLHSPRFMGVGFLLPLLPGARARVNPAICSLFGEYCHAFRAAAAKKCCASAWPY